MTRRKRRMGAISRLVATIGIVAAVGSACRPQTEESKYRRALGWTDVEDVRRQLEAGQDPRRAFEDGAQPIHVVAGSMHANGDILRLLLERGADVNATDADGKTAWDLKWGDGERKLSDDDAVILTALLDGGFEPPKGELEHGRTLLHAVARRVPSARLVSQLVDDHGFVVDARDDDGWTPLHVAVFENNNEAAAGLLEKHADPDAETSKAVGHHTNRGRTVAWDWVYEAGSHPLDVYRSSSPRGRFEKDVRKVLEQYGATKNPAVKNKPR